MSVIKGLRVQELLKRGSIKDLDVARFRKALHEDADLSRAEAETLVKINDGCPVQDASWSALYIKALTAFIVNCEPPEGYVTVENGQWLMARVARDGRIDSKTKLELLVNVLDKARWAPESLCIFALDQVKRAVISGEGPIRAGQSIAPGKITAAEVDLVRRILFAFAGSGGVAVTKGEAEVLFDIEEALGEGEVNAAWTDLFVKAVANALMSAIGHKMPAREEALRSGAWHDRRGDLSPAAMIGAMVESSLDGIWSSYREQSREEQAIERLEVRRIEIITNEAITPVGAEWLAQRLTRDGRVSANERAIIDYLKTASPRIGPALLDLVGKIGKAA